MSRMYTIEFEGSAQAAAIDFFELQPADDKPITIHAIYVSQSTEFGDAAEEMIRLRLIRFASSYTSGSAGTTVTPKPADTNNTIAAGFVAEIRNTTQAVINTGTQDNLHSESFNVRTGWVYLPTPEMRATAKQADALVLAMLAAPVDSITWALTAYVEEA